MACDRYDPIRHRECIEVAIDVIGSIEPQGFAVGPIHTQLISVIRHPLFERSQCGRVGRCEIPKTPNPDFDPKAAGTGGGKKRKKAGKNQ